MMVRNLLGILFLTLALPLCTHADPTADTYYQTGNQLYVQGQYRLSVPYYESVTQLDPNNWKPYQALGGTEFRLGEYDKTIQNYQMSLKLNPNNPSLANYLNVLSAHPLQSVPQGPNASTYYQAGNRLYAQKQYLLAVPYYQSVLREDPNNWKASQALGGCYMQLNQPDKAIDQYQKSLAINPNNPGLADYVKTLQNRPMGTPLPAVTPNPTQVVLATPTPRLVSSEMAFVPPSQSTPSLTVTLAATPTTFVDSRLPHSGSLIWELGAALINYSYSDLNSFYAPATLSLPDQFPLETEFDLGAVYSVTQSLEVGLQFQYMAKEDEVIYSTYQAYFSGAYHTTTAITTWTEAALGGALEVKYLLPLDNDLRLILEGQGGFYTLTNASVLYQGGTYIDDNLNATSLGGGAGFTLEWMADKGWGIDLGIGYRGLSFTAPTTAGFLGNNNSNVTVDFSGLRADLTTRFF